MLPELVIEAVVPPLPDLGPLHGLLLLPQLQQLLGDALHLALDPLLVELLLGPHHPRVLHEGEAEVPGLQSALRGRVLQLPEHVVAGEPPHRAQHLVTVLRREHLDMQTIERSISNNI